jgi:hypothetical protein
VRHPTVGLVDADIATIEGLQELAAGWDTNHGTVALHSRRPRRALVANVGRLPDRIESAGPTLRGIVITYKCLELCPRGDVRWNRQRGAGELRARLHEAVEVWGETGPKLPELQDRELSE